MTRQWTHLERQEGAIGTRGPGETQLETDRRTIRHRIDFLKKELERIEMQRTVRRKKRRSFKKVALVGYTNAGKSSLMNLLANAEVFVEDRLFATLDTTIRAFYLKDREKVLLIDTVGFIKKLPHHLIASFRSTLAETLEADCLLHVVDVSHPRFDEHIGTVQEVLKDLEIDNRPTIVVFNKVDLLGDRQILQTLKHRFNRIVFTSATKGIGIETLREEISTLFSEAEVEEIITLPVDSSKFIAFLHETATVLEKTYTDGMVVVRFRTNSQNVLKIQTLLKNANENEDSHSR